MPDGMIELGDGNNGFRNWRYWQSGGDGGDGGGSTEIGGDLWQPGLI
jgi:hypothetical protein